MHGCVSAEVFKEEQKNMDLNFSYSPEAGVDVGCLSVCLVKTGEIRPAATSRVHPYHTS